MRSCAWIDFTNVEFNTDLEAFHKPNLSDWQSFTVARIMDEMIHAQTYTRSTPKPTQTIGPRKQQQCRWPGTCTNTWIYTHFLLLFYTHTLTHFWFWPIPFVHVHNLLYRSTPNEAPQWVWLDLIRGDSVEAGGEGGEYRSVVRVLSSLSGVLSKFISECLLCFCLPASLSISFSLSHQI